MTRVAVVLAGGEGRRMGGHKPLRPFGDTTLIGRALAEAHANADVVAVAVRHLDQAGRAPDAPQILDDLTLAGPLAGLASALAFARRKRASHVLTLPCDAPRLPADLRQRLEAALADNSSARVAVAASAGRLHPICALWPSTADGDLRRYAASGQSSLKGFAGELGMVVVDWDIAGEDPFANANTPEELAALQPVS